MAFVKHSRQGFIYLVPKIISLLIIIDLVLLALDATENFFFVISDYHLASYFLYQQFQMMHSLLERT